MHMHQLGHDLLLMHHARETLQESEEHLEEVHSSVSVGRIEVDEDALHLLEIGRHLSWLRQAVEGALAHFQLHSHERRLAGVPDEGGNQRSSVVKHSGAVVCMHT